VACRQHFTGDCCEVDCLALFEAPLAAGQGNQCLDEALLLGVGGEDVPGGVPPHACGGAGVVERDLQHGALAGERGTQFV